MAEEIWTPEKKRWKHLELVTSLASGLLWASYSCVASCLNLFETWNGDVQTIAPNGIQLGSIQNPFQITQNALWKCSWFLIKVKTSAKNDEYISRTFWIFELTHIVFELEHLNPINIFKCSNNSETSWGLLEIFSKVPTIILRILQNELVFLLIQNRIKEIEN